MPTAVSLTDAEARRSPKEALDVVDFIGGHQQLDVNPQAFLVDVHVPDYVIKPHFHLVDQFQAIVSGDGTFGRHHPISAGSLHYADAYTPYGPIVAGEEGLAFFTLRARADGGIHYMPGSRHEMKRKAGRNLSADASPVVSPGATESTLFEDEDGVRALRLQAGAGRSLEVPGVSAGGAYLVVLSGELEHDGRRLASPACLFIDAGTERFSGEVGPDGAVAVLLQFAVQAET